MTDHFKVIGTKDGPREEFDWGELHWICNQKLFTGAALTFGECTILPGKQNARHAHPNGDEILYVISGECIHSAGEEAVTLKPGMAIYINSGIPHAARCIGDQPFRAIIAYTSGDRKTELAK
jgi:quercetin dioxygenase-like cupin family protein